MTVMTETTDKRSQATVLPAHLAPFRGSRGSGLRVRTDYPVYLGSRTLAPGPGNGTGSAGAGALCLGFEALLERARRALEGEGTGIGQILRDNLKRLEARVLDLLAEAPGGAAEAAETLRAAGAAVAEELATESSLSEADQETLRADVERLAGALPPAAEGEARFVGPSPGLSLLFLRHALIGGRSTTRETFVRESRELIARGRALLDADRRKDPEAREKEAVEGSMGQMGTRFLNPSAMVSVLGERRGSQALGAERRERLERAVETLAEVADAVSAPRVRVLHDGTVDWIERMVGAGTDSARWIAVESSDPCAVAADVFDREAERLADALRARERIRLETSGEYEAARHEPWLERLEGLDWRAFDLGEVGLVEPVLAVESAGELAERGMISLSKLFRSGRPVQVLVELDPAASPGSAALDGFRFEPAYLGMSHREAFVQQSSEARPLHLMEGFLRAASSSRASLHVVAPWPEARASIAPALVAGAAIESRAHPLFRYDPETGPSWAHRLDFSGNPEPEADWPTGETITGEEPHPFTFADFALLEPALAAHLTPLSEGSLPEGLEKDDLLPLAEWLELPADEALHKVPTIGGVDADDRAVVLRVSRPLARACRDRLGYWRMLQELAGVKSEYVRRAAEATREEMEEAARAERERLEAAHAAELERVRERASREAVDRLTAALLDVDLGLFAETVPAVPSFAGKTPEEVAESLMAAIGDDLGDALDATDPEAGDGDGGPSDAVAEAAERLMGLIDLGDVDEEGLETSE